MKLTPKLASQHDEQLATVTELTEKNDSTTTPTTPPITNCTNTTPPKTEPNKSDMLDMTPPTEQTEPRKTVIEGILTTYIQVCSNSPCFRKQCNLAKVSIGSRNHGAQRDLDVVNVRKILIE